MVKKDACSNCYCLCSERSLWSLVISPSRTATACAVPCRFNAIQGEEDTLSLCPAPARPNFGLASTPPSLPFRATHVLRPRRFALIARQLRSKACDYSCRHCQSIDRTQRTHALRGCLLYGLGRCTVPKVRRPIRLRHGMCSAMWRRRLETKQPCMHNSLLLDKCLCRWARWCPLTRGLDHARRKDEVSGSQSQG
jgi:hypothetical protein